MRFEMKMPDLATTDSEIRIARWIIEPGQRVERGQPLLEVETDKATMDVESVVSGTLAEVRAEADQAVGVGQIIAVLDIEECPVSVPAQPRGAVPRHQIAATVPGGMFARNRAARASAGGAIAPAARTDSTPTPSPPDSIALSLAERTAAKRLQESKHTVPHFYLQTSVNASAMIAKRETAASARPVWDAFFVLAVAKAIVQFDRFRCRFDGEKLTPAETDAIGVAVDVDGELFVAPIASPATKNAGAISDEIRRSVAAIRGGESQLRRLQPALMTVTNLGGSDVESFVPIINPPEPAILGIGKVRPAVVARDDGSILVEPRCIVTLSVDHRVASGKYAGDFLGAIVKELES